jgi:hypothetical protein
MPLDEDDADRVQRGAGRRGDGSELHETHLVAILVSSARGTPELEVAAPRAIEGADLDADLRRGMVTVCEPRSRSRGVRAGPMNAP